MANGSTREFAAAVLAGAVAVALAASYASLIAGGSLVIALPAVLGSTVIALVCGAAIRAWRGSAPFIVGGPSGNATAILAAASASLAATAPSAAIAAGEVGVLGAASGLAAGVTFTFMARMRAGRIARYLPYPVVAGVLAGTGLLLLTGAYRLVGPTPRLGVAVAVAAVVIAGRRTRSPALVMLAAIVGGSVAVDAALRLAGLDHAAASAAGWSFPPFSGTAASWTWWSAIRSVDAAAAVTIAATVATVVLATGLVTLFDIAAIELDSGVSVDLDAELGALGTASLVAGVLGGPVAVIMGTPTLAGRRAGATTTLAPYTAAVMGALVLLAGGPLLALLPRPALAGVLLATGGGIAWDWLLAAWRRLSRTDAAIVTIIATTMVTAGFVPAVALGVLGACVVFVVRYSRGDVVHDAQTLRTLQSRVERPRHQREVLRQSGDAVAILRLHGYVFFGSANALYERVAGLIGRERPPDAVLLDFSRVEGVDASAAAGLEKAARAARGADVALDFCGVTAAVSAIMDRNGGALAKARRFTTIDEALVEWEETILGEELLVADPLRDTFGAQLLERARPHFTRVELDRSDVLFRHGAAADSLYFVVSGRLDVIASGTRVRTLLPGTMVGEMAVYTGEPRSATVVAALPTVVIQLDAEHLGRLTTEDPEIADALHRAVVRAQADRLRAANTAIALGG